MPEATPNPESLWLADLLAGARREIAAFSQPITRGDKVVLGGAAAWALALACWFQASPTEPLWSVVTFLGPLGGLWAARRGRRGVMAWIWAAHLLGGLAAILAMKHGMTSLGPRGGGMLGWLEALGGFTLLTAPWLVATGVFRFAPRGRGGAFAVLLVGAVIGIGEYLAGQVGGFEWSAPLVTMGPLGRGGAFIGGSGLSALLWMGCALSAIALDDAMNLPSDEPMGLWARTGAFAPVLSLLLIWGLGDAHQFLPRGPKLEADLLFVQTAIMPASLQDQSGTVVHQLTFTQTIEGMRRFGMPRPAKNVLVLWPEGMSDERMEDGLATASTSGGTAGIVHFYAAGPEGRQRSVVGLFTPGQDPQYAEQIRPIPFHAWLGWERVLAEPEAPNLLMVWDPLQATDEAGKLHEQPFGESLSPLHIHVLVDEEGAYAPRVWNAVRKVEPDLLINPTRDGNFAPGVLVGAYILRSAMRAVESGVPLARVSAMGPSAILKADGGIELLCKQGERDCAAYNLVWKTIETPAGSHQAGAGFLMVLGIAVGLASLFAPRRQAKDPTPVAPLE